MLLVFITLLSATVFAQVCTSATGVSEVEKITDAEWDAFITWFNNNQEFTPKQNQFRQQLKEQLEKENPPEIFILVKNGAGSGNFLTHGPSYDESSGHISDLAEEMPEYYSQFDGCSSDRNEPCGRRVTVTNFEDPTNQPITLTKENAPWAAGKGLFCSYGSPAGCGNSNRMRSFFIWYLAGLYGEDDYYTIHSGQTQTRRYWRDVMEPYPLNNGMIFLSVDRGLLQMASNTDFVVETGPNEELPCKVEHALANDYLNEFDRDHISVGYRGGVSGLGTATEGNLYDIASPKDGDENQASCEDVGGFWDNDRKCCGDDGADQGASIANNPQNSGGGGLVLLDEDTPSLPFTKICNFRDSLPLGWIDATEHVGHIFAIGGTEYLATATGFESVSGSCRSRQVTSEAGTFSYFAVSGSGKPTDNNHWHQCSEMDGEPGPNVIVTGGRNRDVGESLTCGDTEYVCVKNTASDAFEWVTRNDLDSNPDYAASCNEVGSSLHSYVWTGTRCCYGDQLYEDPVSLEDIANEEYQDSGVCIHGRHLRNDLPQMLPKPVQSLVSSFGSLHSCGNNPFSIGSTDATCTVTDKSVPSVVDETTPLFVCSYDGDWQDIEGDESDLVLTPVPDGFNLLRNPAFDGGVTNE